MIIACIILSSFALLAAAVNITLYLVDKKRDPDRRQALLDYIDNITYGVQTASEELISENNKAFSESLKEYIKENSAFIEHTEKCLYEHSKEIEILKNGGSPDYNKALEAAKAVNDFNASIVSIMNFDPVEAVRRKRNNGTKEDE